MATQPRSDATRHLIMDAAVELFAQSGYGNVALSDVIARARVTRGACHYHFANKEALAAALITHADDAMLVAAAGAAVPGASTLENLIRSTFAMAALIRRDAKVRIGMQLGQALAQISQTAMAPYSPERAAVLVEAIKLARDDGDLDDGIDIDAAGHLIWCAILGNYFLADAAGEDVVTGLAKIWRQALHGFVAPGSASFFQNLVDRLSAEYHRSARKDKHGYRVPAPSRPSANSTTPATKSGPKSV